MVIKILVGTIVGFLVGMTGMGGGAVMTPFLILFLKMNPVLAVGTDLVFSTLTKISGAIQHRRQGTVWLRPLFWMALGSVPASWIGSAWIVYNVNNPWLTEDFMPKLLGSVLILVSGIVLARVTRFLGPHEWVIIRWPTPLASFIIGVVGGLLVGTTSVGGGTVIMALLLLFYSIPLSKMVGLDVAHGAVLSLAASITYIFAGQVDWSLIWLMMIGAVPGVVFGAWMGKRASQRMVRGILGCLLLVAGASMLVN